MMTDKGNGRDSKGPPDMPDPSDIKDYHAHVYYDPKRSRDRADESHAALPDVCFV